MGKSTEWSEASLFSLELVVEKLYIPHVVCRFPAVAFRLLDFPVILVKHVEEDLAKTIKRKIDLDPYYEVGDQITELKDRHGNFMVNKGKSCLFKIGLDSFKNHLLNTPLYVMILDDFPDVPKLIANTTIPLDDIMNNLCIDIKRSGNSIPAAHGDKGLFKVYSLMGKEIGYMIVGYRLLSLGPSLIPHIPETYLMNSVDREVQDIDKTIDKQISEMKECASMSTMTEVKTCHMTSQTINEEDLPVQKKETKEIAVDTGTIPVMNSACTQTKEIKHKKKTKKPYNVYTKPTNVENDMLTSNMFCPPPLFYNSNAEPQEREPVSYDDMSTCTESLCNDIHVDEVDDNSETVNEGHSHSYSRKSSGRQQKTSKPSAIGAPTIQNLVKDSNFPLLSALMDELACLQNPELRNVNHQDIKVEVRKINDNVRHDKRHQSPVRNKILNENQNPKTVNEPKQAWVVKNEKPEPDVVSMNTDCNAFERQSHKACAHADQGVPKNKGWIRNTPEVVKKKSKLTYRMTNSQRLRLEKANPKWLKSVDKGKVPIIVNNQKQTLKPDVSVDNFNETHLSDTVTEIRKHPFDDTMDTCNSLSTIGTPGRKIIKHSVPSPEKATPRKSQAKSLNRSSGSKMKKQPSPNVVRKSKSKQLKKAKRVSSGLHGEKKTMNEVKDEGCNTKDINESQSTKSIEVRVPSVAKQDETYDNFDDVSNVTDINKSPHSVNFPQFVENFTAPDPIRGKHNESVDVSFDACDKPLESTRYSRDFHNDFRDSKKSSGDFTRKTFESGEEPELRKLISDDESYSEMSSEKSNVVDVPSKKFQMRNPVLSDSSPTPATRKSQVRIDFERATLIETDTPRTEAISKASHDEPTPTPRSQKVKKLMDRARYPSMHTDSISSYAPSDPENMSYSDDFNVSDENDSVVDILSSIDASDIMKQRFIPSTKLGYTIG